MAVEIFEATVIRYISLKFKKPAVTVIQTAQLIQPLTATSGIPICNTRTPVFEGTGGFFVSNELSLYLLTAWHVLFKANPSNSQLYKWNQAN